VVISLFLIGILGCIPSKPAVGYAQAALAVSWLAIYSLTVGPIVYTIVAEIGATRLRTQTVVLGRSTYYVANIIGGVIQPYMINPTEWNLKGKTAFFWFGASFLTLVWAYL
jgi:SP family general alpha glucoside:H+ symporter-like MFS transporter